MIAEQLVDEDEADEHNGFTLTLYYDQDCESPRDNVNIGLFLGRDHRHYNIGDETIPGEIEERGPRFVERWIKIHYRPRVLLRVGMIDHSSVHYYVGGGAHPCDPGGWDSGTCGWIFDTPELLKECGFGPEAGLGCEISDEELRKQLEGEISEYDSWASGDCYGYVIERGETVDSCFGFLGYDYAVSCAREQLAWYEENEPPLAEVWMDDYLRSYA